MPEDVSEDIAEEESEASEEEHPPTRPPAAEPKRKRHVLRWISLAVVLIILGGLVAAWAMYKRIDNSIHRVPVTGLGKRPHVYSTGSENILVFGSDSRSGLDHHEQVVLHTGDASDSSGAGNTDTIMLLHISPGRRQVTAMSIPRDTMVPEYACAAGPGYRGQAQNLAARERINSLLSIGGVSCLWKTVEQQTGIPIDHFLEVGLAGFANVINDLGGVEVCSPFAVNDPVSGLVLRRGEQHIGGTTALAFWRTREDLGVGSDLQRIQRDQFMSAQVVKGVLRSGLLSDPGKLLQVADGLAPNLTTDSSMSTPDLVSLAASLHGLSGKNVHFVTAPTAADPGNPDAVDFAQPQADELFSAIARDTTGSGTDGRPAASSPATSPAVAGGVPAAQVKVAVLNGNGTAGIAAVTAGELASRGFTITGTGNAPVGYSSSVIEYGSSPGLPAARTLLAQVPGAVLREVPGLGSAGLVLILGTGFTDLAPQPASAGPGTPSVPATPSPVVSASPSVPASGSSPASGSASPSASPSGSASGSASPTATGGVGSAATASGGIDASASCTADASAFQGPLSP